MAPPYYCHAGDVLEHPFKPGHTYVAHVDPSKGFTVKSFRHRIAVDEYCRSCKDAEVNGRTVFKRFKLQLNQMEGVYRVRQLRGGGVTFRRHHQALNMA